MTAREHVLRVDARGHVYGLVIDDVDLVKVLGGRARICRASRVEWLAARRARRRHAGWHVQLAGARRWRGPFATRAEALAWEVATLEAALDRGPLRRAPARVRRGTA